MALPFYIITHLESTETVVRSKVDELELSVVINKALPSAAACLEDIKLHQNLVLVISKYSRSLDGQLELDFFVLLLIQLLLLLRLKLQIAVVEDALPQCGWL